jgi:hypothetical protein
MSVQEKSLEEEGANSLGKVGNRRRIRPSWFRRVVVGPTAVILDGLYHLLIWVIVTLVIGTLVTNYLGNALQQFVATGDPSSFGVSSLRVAPQILDHVDLVIEGLIGLALLGILSWAAHKVRHPDVPGGVPPELAAYYHITQIAKVDPSAGYNNFYRPIYIPRKEAGSEESADAKARNALKDACGRTELAGVSLGICVTGRTASGTTRLAFEAMKKELSDWTFVDWQADPQRW